MSSLYCNEFLNVNLTEVTVGLLALAKGATPDSGGWDRPAFRGRLKLVVVRSPAQKREFVVTISYMMQIPTSPQTTDPH